MPLQELIQWRRGPEILICLAYARAIRVRHLFAGILRICSSTSVGYAET